MSDTRTRLVKCFSAVFPELTAEEIAHANPASVMNWDSVAAVTILSTVEEEFDVTLSLGEVDKFNSFTGILSYLEAGQQ